MFSKNGKISNKQLTRMLMLTIFAGMIYVIPYLSAVLFGESVVWGIVSVFLLSILYISAIYGIGFLAGLKQTEDESLKKERKQNKFLDKYCPRIILVLQIIRQMFNFVFYIVLSIAILGQAEVPFMEGSSTNSYWNLLMVLPLIFVALYGANHNVEKVGRLFEMLFWVIYIPFIVMILFGLKEVDYSVFVPKLQMPFGQLLLYSCGLVSFVVPVEQYLFLRPNLLGSSNDNLEQFCNASRRSYFRLIFTVGLIGVLSLFIYGIYGVVGASMEEMVTVDIMRYIRLPLGVLERFDVLMVWFFMLGCFVLLCSSLFYCGHLVTKSNCGKRIYWLLGLVFASLILVLWLPDYKETLWLYLCYGVVINLPLSIILPLVETIL